MDPITRASQAFLAEAEAFWQDGRRPVLPMIAGYSERSDLVKTLRLKELSLENRRPMFLYEEAFDEPRAYFEGFTESVQKDYEQIRKGAAEEGVTLAPFSEAPSNGEGTHTPLERAVLAVEQAAELLGDHLDGVLAALVPVRVVDGKRWQDSIAALARTRLSARVRWAIFNPPGGPLSEVFGSEGARFHVDPDELVAFLKEIGKGGSAGPATQAPPALTEEQKRAYEVETGRKLPAPETAVMLRGLLLDATQCTAAGKHAEAGALYRDARRLCQKEGLVLEEAVLLVALGGACLGAGTVDAAVESYRQAAELAQTKEAWPVVCQAWLGVGGAHLTGKRYEAAAIAYRQAAEAAKRAGITVLHVEALRMEGTVLLLRGMKQKAVEAWLEAVHAGAALDTPARTASTFPQVAAALVDLLRRLGLTSQADYVRSLVDAHEEQVDAGSESPDGDESRLPSSAPAPAPSAPALATPTAPAPIAAGSNSALPAWSEETVRLPSGLSEARSVLPFTGKSPVHKPPPAEPIAVAAALDAERELPPWAGETVGLSFGLSKAQSVLPFVESSPAAQPAPPAAMAPVAPPPVVAEKPDLPTWVEETARLPPGFTNRQSVLPFGAEPSKESVDAVSARPESDLPSWSGETVGLPLEASAIRRVLPFPEQPAPTQTAIPQPGEASGGPVARAAEQIHGLSLQQYASLWAELAVFPERSMPILARYGVRDEEARNRLNEAWAQRFLKDPALRQTWITLHAQYRDWLLRTKR